jgi:hypothetical protein
MPSLNISSPGVPPPPTALSPIAANPIAAIDGAVPPVFASVIGGLGQGFTLDASPPLGTNLPPQRPEIAGGPTPLPDVDVEAVMVGSAGPIPPAPGAATLVAASVTDLPASAPAPDASSADPAIPVDTPIVDPGPVACGLEIWRKGMPRLPHGKIGGPAPVQLPPQETPDMPAVDPVLPPAQADKPIPSAPMPAQAADVPPPAFSPIVWTPPPPQPGEVSSKPASVEDSAPAPTPVQTALTPQPALPKLGTESVPGAPQPAQTTAAQAAPLPNSFTLPPDVTREIAQLVKAAVGERDEHGSSDAADAAPLPAIAALPLPQAISSQPASLHPSFVAAQRPAIDTGRADWIQTMIDRIAEMPQAEGGRRDAQIRLVPDALGPIDVKIEQRQDRLQVTLHAETPQARLLLSDAAPKLHELAEARGIRFAQAGFGGADSQDRRPPSDQQLATPLRPRSTAPTAAESDSHSDGDLIA